MIRLEAKTDCCGCTACYAACPVRAISMEPDEEGFLYPQVDADACIGCGRCERVCPVIARREVPYEEGEPPRTYAVRCKDDDVLAMSTSGGFTTPLVNWVVGRGGAVCAAAFGEGLRVEHQVLRGPDAAARTRGSKYVQSFMGDSFLEVRKLLLEGVPVLFVGTPCQVAGLKAYLRRDYDNLLTVDMVCHGVPSPKLWGKYVAYQEEVHGSRIVAASFRHKTYGYHSGTMRLEFENGDKYYGSARVDYMLRSFFKEIASRPICYECPFKTLHHSSDFSVFDCWHVSELVDGLEDDDRGYTSVLVQSEKGAEVLDDMADDMACAYEVHEVDTARAVKLDGVMVLNAAEPHPQRAEYYDDLDSEPLPEHIQRFIPVSRKDLLVERSKGLLHRLGVLRWLKSLQKGFGGRASA